MTAMNSDSRNFWIINTLNTLFFSGYLILKFPLAYILEKHGVPLQKAYALTTASTTAVALCSLALILILKKYHHQKQIFVLGIALICIATLLLESQKMHCILAGLSAYVLGSSLYFFNFTLMLNKQFSTQKDRLRGNYIAQICLNVGAFFGCIVILLSIGTANHYFTMSFCITLATLLLSLIGYQFLRQDAVTLRQQSYFFIQLIFLFAIIFMCLQLNEITRWVVLIAFSVATLLALIQAKKHQEKSYFVFIILILLFSLPLWIGNTVIYNQFFIFLHRHVSTWFGIPAIAIIMLDPATNIIFGLFWEKITRHHLAQARISLTLGMYLFVIAFGVLAFALWINHATSIAIIYPVITLVLFSCAQFLIQPTMHAYINHLSDHHHHRVFALGILRAIRAVAASIAFYLINTTISTTTAPSWNQNITLYTSMTAIGCVALALFYGLRKTHDI
ncbi:MAG: hypothetical protein A3I77_08560 [Gammaproteobacteria bacterium RIFCSPLOWO2_02_FULL_42_14]|nr:MAG: hypothetical protein A3B71_07185 [Gammaproteobacteria bacterium RIFCSPHIGHO2_02_FULL_42_43]OGT28924.1 MAG: hypothetical protein A2624_02100 [Gammaproteobacteria bacterium RIFCSPHIGHO2_01_FULL_42_8]OGT53624.1 MAG: hypothetical protein A3E54_02765 [Gammaproteobacteria bacterium RIFCSPHIGHO2_12_FULL_41_25]OGT61675.1 MAG: hypothetical protein A3I77_08560 [Gammaproteobacteria bacterium RIFCSPLOWO2_02_FULL_42_14]OGT85434.1 MAG: hypothetical protein A3G86_08270 [Gammaproteobacteria bacterium R